MKHNYLKRFAFATLLGLSGAISTSAQDSNPDCSTFSDDEFRNSSVEFCEENGDGLVDLTLKKGDNSNYIIHWWQGADTLTGYRLGDDKEASFFENLSAGDAGTFSYQLVDAKTGCKGEVHNYEFTINPIPYSPQEEHIQYTINGKKEVLATDRFVQSLDDTKKLVWFTSDDPKKEPNSNGSTSSFKIDRTVATTTPYLFYIAYKDGDCYSKRAQVQVEVLAAPCPSVRNIDLCKGGTYDVKDAIVKTDDDYELVWFENDKDTVGKAFTSAPTDLVDVTTPGRYRLYVAQRSKTPPYAQSDVVSFNVIVYGVKAPLDASKHEYCAHDAAEELKAEKVTDEPNYYYADEIVYVYGSDEQPTIMPDTKTSESQEYVYEAYQKYTTPYSMQVCTGPSVKIVVDVVAAPKPIVTQTVSYVKEEAVDKTFVDILTKNPDVIEIPELSSLIISQNLLWAKVEPGPFVKGSTTSSKPTYDDKAVVGEVEKQERYVILEVETASGMVCHSEPSKVDITISSTPAPIVSKIEVCEDDFKAGLIAEQPVDKAKINDNEGRLSNAASYVLVWFDNQKDADDAMTNPVLLTTKGKTTAPTFEDVFSGVDMTDQTAFEWAKSLFVVQTYDNGTGNITTSPASEMKLTVNATPKLQAVAHEPVCNGPVNLTDNKYWRVSNEVMVTASYFDKGGNDVSASASGLTVSGEYSITGTSSYGCKSAPLNIQVDIRTLAINIDPTSSTCPGFNTLQEVSVDYSYNKNSIEALNNNISLTWKSTELTSDKLSQTGTLNPDGTSFLYTSGNFNGKAGDIQTIEIEVTDGYCVATARQKVVLGNGPAEGLFSWSELNNLSLENGVKIPLTDANKEKIEINACGDDVTIDFTDVTKDDDNIEWYTDADFTQLAKVGVTQTFKKEEYGTYYVRYMNRCYAYATVKIVDASVKINSLSENNVVMCENNEYKIDINVTSPAGKPKCQWYKDGNAYENSSDGLSFTPLKKEDQGLYRVEYSYDGCSDYLDVVDLKVKEYIKVDVEDYDIYAGQKGYIIIAGEDAYAPLTFTVPSSSNDIAGLTATVTDNAAANQGTLAEGNSAFIVTRVNEDHKVSIKFESDDYCEGSIEFNVLRDARLKLRAEVETAMCPNEEKMFTVDTTGTGKFLRPGAELKITSSTDLETWTQEKDFVLDNGLLKKNISPSETTHYHVSFSYGAQRMDTMITVTVYDFKVMAEDKTVCAGESVELSATASPEGTNIEWLDEDKATVLGKDVVTVAPEHQGSGKVYMHKYWARPYSDIVNCNATVMTPLAVTVYSNPVIAAIDSSNKKYEVVMNPEFGTPDFKYTLDNGESTFDNVFVGLTNGMHTIRVEDANGCSVVDSFKVNNTDGIESILAEEGDGIINVYSISGALIKANVKRSEALKDLSRGIYIVGKEKMEVKK